MGNSDPLNIMVLASDPAVIRLLECYLEESDLSTDVTWCNNCDLFLTAQKNHDTDVLLVNHQLKNHTGFDFIKELSGRGKEAPVILLSERGDAEMASKAIRIGFDDYRSTAKLSPSSLQNAIEHAIKKHKEKQRLKQLARTDQLTGLLNRHTIIDRLKGEMKRASRSENVSSILLMDVDNFKAVNDQFGHVAGDKALRTISDNIDQTIRDSDFAGRYGGDEFLVISPNTDLSGVCQLGRRILREIEQQTIPQVAEEDSGLCSISAGCAHFGGVDQQKIGDEEVKGLINQADSALYVAKNNGGNSIERRQSEREPVDDEIDTKIISNDQRCEGELIDLSDAGVGVLVDHPFSRNEDVKVQFNGSTITDAGKELSGEIAWVKKTENGTYQAGIHTEQQPPLNI